MMDFLRGLAPARESDTTRASAVLPSRFDSEGSLVAGAAAPQPLEGGDDQDRPAVRLISKIPTARVDTTAAPAAGFVSRPTAVVVRSPVAVPRDRNDMSDATAPLREDHASPVTSVERRPVQQRPVIHEKAPETFDNARASRAAMPESPKETVRRHERQNEAGALLRQPNVSRAPMSEAAVAQRTARSAERPAIVHVTIDRIDVRAPATQSRPVATPKARPASRVSLADYLRGDTGRNGDGA